MAVPTPSAPTRRVQVESTSNEARPEAEEPEEATDPEEGDEPPPDWPEEPIRRRIDYYNPSSFRWWPNWPPGPDGFYGSGY